MSEPLVLDLAACNSIRGVLEGALERNDAASLRGALAQLAAAEEALGALAGLARTSESAAAMLGAVADAEQPGGVRLAWVGVRVKTNVPAEGGSAAQLRPEAEWFEGHVHGVGQILSSADDDR